MRKSYIEEDGVKYDERTGSCLLSSFPCSPSYTSIREYNEKYPIVLVSEEERSPNQLREIEGKLYYLKKCASAIGSYQKVKNRPVFRDRAFLPRKYVGYVEGSDHSESSTHTCYWIPLTLDMLHKDNKNDNDGTTD